MRANSALLTKMALLAPFLFCVSGAASARAFGQPVIYPADGTPFAIVVADFDSDGNLDLAVANALTNDVSILLGNGDGSFRPPVNYQVGTEPVQITLTCETVAAGSRLDLAVTNLAGNTVSVLVGNGDGTFQPAVDYGLGSGTLPYGILGSADFNKDGNCDLVVANGHGGASNNGNIAILLGNGDGTFQPAVNYDTLGIQPTGLASGDFNNDLSPDLAVTDGGSADVTIFLNDGSGGFTTSAYTVGVGPWSIAVYEGTNLVVGSATAYSGGKISLLYGNGDGTFKNIRNYSVGSFPVSIATGFLNQDSTPDIAATDYNTYTLDVLLGRPASKLGFRRPAVFPSCLYAPAIVAFDFNHDNKTDLAVACSDGVGVLLNTGP
ncbi:MAG TPA: VCBS repeat-containing protein [Terriglobales bacterium]|jgi:hypothetical protein|nr:VCBS repeat-containing protein [Terriglobales bacterium]